MDYPSNNPNIRPLPGAGPAPDVPGIFSPASPGSWIYDFDPFTQKARATFNGLVDVSLTPPVLPNIPPGTVLGNESGAEGPPTALTQAQLATLIGTFATVQPGLVPAQPNSSPFLQVMMGDGTWRPPQGTAASTGTSYTIRPTDGFIFVITSAGTPVLTLPAANSVFVGWRIYVYVQIQNGVPLTIQTAGPNTILTTALIGVQQITVRSSDNLSMMVFVSDGNNNWYCGFFSDQPQRSIAPGNLATYTMLPTDGILAPPFSAAIPSTWTLPQLLPNMSGKVIRVVGGMASSTLTVIPNPGNPSGPDQLFYASGTGALVQATNGVSSTPASSISWTFIASQAIAGLAGQWVLENTGARGDTLGNGGQIVNGLAAA
jgi:hypothetical protein